MRITDFYMKNFIPFYNGMGLTEIKINNIDRYGKRMIFIHGDNGRGKSTLENALSPLLDDKNIFMKGLEGEKDLRIVNGDDIYNIKIIYPVTSSGERSNTKAFFSKNNVELNTNGNVTSYKDLVYLEFNLDSNFEALSKLSCEDKGLVAKSPSERKRYVSFIIDEVADYNTMQKTFIKRSSNYNALLNQISLKLEHLGNTELLNNELQQSLIDKNDITNKIEINSVTLGELKNKINTLNAEETKTQYQNIANKILSLNNINDSKYKDISKLEDNSIEFVKTALDTLSSELEISLQPSISNLNSEITRIRSIIDTKQEMLNNLNNQKMINSDESLSDIKAKISELKIWIDNTLIVFDEVGYNPKSNMNTDRLINLYNIFIEIDSTIDVFLSSFSIDLVSDLYSRPNDNFDIDDIINDYERRKSMIPYTQDELELKLELLNEKPKECLIDCPFITRLSKVNLSIDNINNYLNLYAELDKEYVYIEKQKVISNEYIKAKHILHDIFRMMYMSSRDTSLLGLKRFETINDTIEYITSDDIYSKNIQSLINISSLIDEFNIKNSVYIDYITKINSSNYNQTMIDELEKDIQLQINLFNQYSNSLLIAKKQEEELIIKIDFFTKALDSLTIINNNSIELKTLVETRKSMESDFLQVSQYDTQINMILNNNNNLRNILNNLDKNIYRINHALQSKDEYEKQYNEFVTKYSKLEIFKKYSNPSKEGIQVVFIELYMYKVISMCNELLKFVFDGEFSLQKCLIDENEFKIPCLGSGLLIDDVYHMSSGQRAIIGSTMSFALMHHSSSKYNIIRLDEIDAELDNYNRRNLIDVINKEMDILGVEQLFIISHNTEYNTDDGAIIELLHKDERIKGNIIWSYFDL